MTEEMLTNGNTCKILRVDLTNGTTTTETVAEEIYPSFIGGAALGMKYIFDEVKPSIPWADPENRLFIGSGPLGGTRIQGSGSLTVVTKGAMTEGMASTQAAGFFGAFLRFSGFNGILLQGSSAGLVYLYVHDGKAELRDATHLAGKNNFETDDILKAEINKKEREASVLSIGPAGENLVRFAAICVDKGHFASHNGVGAVMGSKRLKAIIVERGPSLIQLKDPATVNNLSKEILSVAMSNKMFEMFSKIGTMGGWTNAVKTIGVPVRNYTTNFHVIAPETLETYNGAAIRSRFQAKPAPCWACSSTHCHSMRIPDGKYAGREVDEPEFEGMNAFTSQTGITDVYMTMVLNGETDGLGLDVNETGWVLGWLMECVDKGLLSSKDLDGINLTWGNSEAVMEILHKIAYRQGVGDILAEGVMRAAQKFGGETVKLPVHSMKGNTPRGLDHRSSWFELFDTAVSNTGTLESNFQAPWKALGLSDNFDRFDPIAVSTAVAQAKGAMIFEDSLVTCRFRSATAVDLLCQAVNAATGWNIDVFEAMKIGKRAVNLARIFNLRAGISPALDRPSLRWGSTPLDGGIAGIGILPHWNVMLKNYYQHMGWDENTGEPLPETLKSLGLNNLVPSA